MRRTVLSNDLLTAKKCCTDPLLAPSADPVLAHIAQRRMRLAEEEEEAKCPSSPSRRLHDALVVQTASAEALLALTALAWGTLLCLSPHLFDDAPGLYAGNEQLMPSEFLWGLPLLISGVSIISGIAWDRASLRSLGIIIQGTIWTMAAVAQFSSESFSGSPAIFALSAFFLFAVRPSSR